MYNRSLKNSEHFSLRLTAYCNLKQYLCFRLPAKIDFAWDQNLTFINDFSIICSFIVKNLRSSTTKFWINFSVFSTRKSLVFWVAGEVGVLVQSIVYPTRRLLYLRDETALPVAVQNSKRKAALALYPTVFSIKEKITILGQQSAGKVVLLRLNFLRGKCKGNRIVPASRSGPQRELSATCWRPVLAPICQLQTDHYALMDERLSLATLNFSRWISRTVFLSARSSKHSALRGAQGHAPQQFSRAI